MSSPDEAKALLEAEKIERSSRALSRITQILEEERCNIVPIILLTNGNVAGRIEVIASD